MNEVNALIEKIHATPHKSVIAVAGAGSQAIAWLLGVSGASRTILETLVPYGRLSMIDLLGNEPAQYVSQQTAQEMAHAAYRRGVLLREDDSPIVGLACTATIATDRTKRGDHRCFIAAWDDARLLHYDLTLEKGARDRAGEEGLVSRLLLNALAQSCGIESGVQLGLTSVEQPQSGSVPHQPAIQRLLSGDVNYLTVGPDGKIQLEGQFQAALFPGSFSPLHHGHETLAGVASEILGTEIAYEISVLNVDKPPLAEEEIRQRLNQFRGKSRVVLTRAETFHKKAKLFPGSSFIIGWDTAVRLVDPKYYDGREDNMLSALADMWASGCRFLVAGREHNGGFNGLAQVPIPPGFRPLFIEIPEAKFRVDVSSSELRS